MDELRDEIDSQIGRAMEFERVTLSTCSAGVEEQWRKEHRAETTDRILSIIDKHKERDDEQPAG